MGEVELEIMQRVARRKSDRPLEELTERELTDLILDYLKWIPNSSFKKIRGSMGMKGILDIIGCWEGRYVEIEVKTQRGKLTKGQRERIEEIKQARGITGVVRSLEDVHQIFGEISRITI